MSQLAADGHQAGLGKLSKSSDGEFCSHLKTNFKNSCSSSRHMFSRLVGDPRANKSGRLDTLTLVPLISRTLEPGDMLVPVY